jgi:hypothetical protein
VYLQHDVGRLGAGFVEMPDQDIQDEFHGGVIVVVHHDFPPPGSLDAVPLFGNRLFVPLGIA